MTCSLYRKTLSCVDPHCSSIVARSHVFSTTPHYRSCARVQRHTSLSLVRTCSAPHLIIARSHVFADFSGLDPALQEILQNISADGYTLFKTKCDICGKMVGNIKRHMMVSQFDVTWLYSDSAHTRTFLQSLIDASLL